MTLEQQVLTKMTQRLTQKIKKIKETRALTKLDSAKELSK